MEPDELALSALTVIGQLGVAVDKTQLLGVTLWLLSFVVVILTDTPLIFELLDRDTWPFKVSPTIMLVDSNHTLKLPGPPASTDNGSELRVMAIPFSGVASEVI